MNNEKDEEAFDFFSRLLRQLQQTERDQRGCNINLVYVASGAQHVNTIQNQNNYCSEKKEVSEDERDPYEALLLQIIEPLKGTGNGRDIFLPYRAGIEEGLLAKWSRPVFIQKTGVDVSKSSYSEWMKEDLFSTEELEPYAERFRQLKQQIDNSK
ncbi:MAG: hypothetical protein J5790_09320 [Bacteroidaceae bacterium]|nr:hypothetical protein [Bacteroidaceae bacterium]